MIAGSTGRAALAVSGFGMGDSWSATEDAKVIDKFYQDCREWKRATNKIAGPHDKISAGELQDLSLGAARRDRVAREEDRLRVSPHRARQPARLVPRHLAA